MLNRITTASVAVLCVIWSMSSQSSGLGDMALGEAFPDSKVKSLVDSALHGDLPGAQSLVRDGANPNYSGKDGILPLVWVIANDHKPWNATKTLLLAGADPNRKFTEATPPSDDSVMYLTAAGDQPELLELLLDHGGNPNISGKFGKTALQYAAEQGRDENIAELLKHGADINGHDTTGLSAPGSALNLSRFDLIVYFLDHGYSYDLKDLAQLVETVAVSKKSPQCEQKTKVLNILHDRGVTFPAIPIGPHSTPISSDCLPDWYPRT